MASQLVNRAHDFINGLIIGSKGVACKYRRCVVRLVESFESTRYRALRRETKMQTHKYFKNKKKKYCPERVI